MNWSTPGNWTGNTPPGTGDDTKFNDQGANANILTVNNIVDTSRTNLSLQFGNTNLFHTTQINPGVTLVLTGTGGLLDGNETSNDSRLTNSITGAGGTLIVTNPAANVIVRQPFATTSTANRTTLDMSGLDTFNATIARVMVGVAASGTLNRATGRLLLARTNVITTSGGAPQVDISDSNGGSNNGGGSTISLGQTNAFFTDSITVGRARESASTFNFNSAFTSPSFFLRGTNGLSSRVSSWTVGDAATQTGTITARGTVNLSIGTIDALVDTLILGQPSLGTGDGSQSVGTVFLGAGTLDVNTLVLGNQRTNNAASGQAILALTGNSVLTVNSNLFLTRTIGGAGATTTTATLNVTNSTINANNITNANNGGGATTINLVTSTLNLANNAGSASQPIGTLSIANSTLQLKALSGSPVVVVNTLTVNGSSDIINISSAPGVGQFPLITFSFLGNQSPDFTIGTLPSGLQGYISNNTTSVDLVITNSSIRTDIWRGNVNGNWDTTTLNWFFSGPTAYQQNDPVIFDDSLTGTPNVNLTTILTPASLFVNNSAENYAFSGSGKISGTNSIIKSGSSTLTLAETGGDDFTGGIVLNGGTLVLDNAASAITGGLTIAPNTIVQIGNNDANGNPPAGTIANNGTLNVLRTDNVIISSVISGSGSLNQNGSGVLTLGANNSFTGGTLVSAGTLALTNAGAISNSVNVTVSTATLDLSGVSSGASVLGNLSLGDSTLVFGYTNQVTPLTTASFSMSGSGNTFKIMALPGIAAYPTTLPLVQSIGGVGNFNVNHLVLPAGYTGSLSLSPDTLTISITLTAGPIGQRAKVIWTGTDVPNLHTNWSDDLNWQLPGKPAPGDNVIFNNGGAQFASALATPGGGFNSLIFDYVDNIVDGNFSLASLVYTNFGGMFHNTYIQSGNVLSITNSGLTIGTLDTGTTAQTEQVSVSGTNATLSLTGTNGNFQVWLGNANISGANNQAILDLSALDTFSGTASRILVGATINNVVNRPSGILYLARTNTLVAAFQTTNNDLGTGTANAGIVIGDCNSTAGTDSSIYLGLVNSVSADTINVGRQKAPAHLLFNPLYANVAPYPTATFHGYSGSRIAFLEIANGAGNTGTTTFSADANFGGGFVNALVDVLNIGRASGGASGSGNTTGTLNFEAGSIDANTVNVGLQPTTGTKVGIGSLGVSSNTVIGAAATLTVNGALNLGATAGGAGASTTAGTLNITNGTVSANAILPGTNSVSTINLMGGRLTSATTIGSAAAPLGTLNLTPLNTANNTATLLQIPASATASVVVTNLNIDGLANTTNRINITSIGAVTAPAELPLIKYTTLTVLNGTYNLGLGTLPSGYIGYLTNDTTLNAIALVVTTAPNVAKPTIKSISIIGGNIVISGTNNFGAGGNFHLLTSTNVALPLSSWSVLTNSTFDGSGNFNLTNAIDSTKRSGFYILQVP